jgi:hypothetical protein
VQIQESPLGVVLVSRQHLHFHLYVSSIVPGSIATIPESPVESVSGAEQSVGLGGLLGIVGGSVPGQHGWSGVAEEELDVYLPALLFDALPPVHSFG